MKVGAYGIVTSRLIRTDRNGTKYYEGTVQCDRCGGMGGHEVWKNTGYTCYKCGGTGVVADHWCERTEEYEEKLFQRRIARLERKAEYERTHAEEVKAQSIAKDAEKSAKAIETCNTRKGFGCEVCPHRVYCTLLTGVIIDLEEGRKIEVLTEKQNALLESLLKIDRSEPVTIETLDGEPCREGRWFKSNYGSSTRCITKPNGEKVYTSATTDRGLAKYGLRNRAN